MLKIVLFLIFTTFSYSQSRTITGVVSDDTNKPLESANVIAKPLQEKASLKFAIADNKGRYRLELEKEVKYEITVSYISFIEEVFILEANATVSTHDFKLKATGEQLDEIVIKHDFKPIIIKKDTLIFDVKSFAKGNERKMKEILEKLPGVEVDKNGGVTVQGKKVTKMLVEAKSFFGGGSKLAVENIPADALDKIEVIDNFNEVGFMKQVSDSDDLAMNVKLKEDKKKFVFGDVEAGAEIGAADNGFYLAHAALFYYAPKTNVSVIADGNNIGKRTFTFDDLTRFGGGMSTFLSGRKSLTNLYSFAGDNRDVVQNKSQFGAFNISHDFSPKLAVSGFSIFSKVLTASKTESTNEYLQNSAIAFENKLQDGDNRTMLGIGNVKLDYSPNKKEKWYYNGQYQLSTNDLINTINSTTNLNTSLFETISKADNTSIKQYVEWHKSYNEHHTTTLVVNQAYDNNKPINNWFTDQTFLAGLIPLQQDDTYTVTQIKKVKTNSIDALFKHYWILNNFNHIYTNVGNNFATSHLETANRQLLTDGTINDFASAGFNNNVKYQLNDAYVGVEYKFRIGKFTSKPGLYLHWYHLSTTQSTIGNSLNKSLLQPQWDIDYEFNKSETLNFTYKLKNDFPEVSQLANQFDVQNYNLVYKGNALLQNEKYHSAVLRYSKYNLYQGVTYNATASYLKKVKAFRNEITLDGINQFSSPILTDNPETTYGITGYFTKRIYRFSLKLNTRFNWFSYSQTLNAITTVNDRTSQNVGLVFKTAYKKWPDYSVGYNKGFSQFSGLTSSKYETDAFTSSAQIDFLKFWNFKIDYENLKNTDDRDQSNFYDIMNASIRYQKKNSPFGFEMFVNNVFDNKTKNDFSFSDYVISERSTYVLPRVWMLSISYKL
ncbi:carboxypeptidase-like regulatory domain-containing protein [Flavobacterium frigidarium]|uniref:carboxypeptidase regulatory-like domain-containing protein n=1 Tax=Flavobacterium frigidarium TaxID=99286 RepID=UPI0030DBB440|tara:strand:+ start:12819 stop:15485 length:2667 start_codon:yes stop_codon:yes gene_type:complete